MRAPHARLTMINTHHSLKTNLKRLERQLSKLSSIDDDAKNRIDIIFTDDRCIKDLSNRFRGSKSATDVLAFRYSKEGFAKDEFPFGEIVVSLDTAKKQAEQRKVTFHNELLLLVLHGLLHIGGQEDETIDAWCDMRKLEFEYLLRIM